MKFEIKYTFDSYIVCMYYNLLLESMIIALAIEIEPIIIPGPSECDRFKFIVNISSPSMIVSFITAMFTKMLLVSAVIMAVCVVELKSTFPPNQK